MEDMDQDDKVKHTCGHNVAVIACRKFHHMSVELPMVGREDLLFFYKSIRSIVEFDLVHIPYDILDYKHIMLVTMIYSKNYESYITL